MNAKFERKLCLTVVLVMQAAAVPVFADQATVEDTQINSSQTRSSESTVPTPTTVPGKDELSSLSQRLQAMKDQIEMGAQKQWLSSSDADALRTKANALAMQTDDLQNSYSKAGAQEVERQTNELNVAISQAMKNAPAPTAVQ